MPYHLSVTPTALIEISVGNDWSATSDGTYNWNNGCN